MDERCSKLVCHGVCAHHDRVVFVATITVPGGSDDGSRLAIFRFMRALAISTVVDALSLFSSTAFILMFLSILSAC